MPRKRHHCVVCGLPDHVCGPLSARNKCERCRTDALLNNIRAMQQRSGDTYDKWKAGVERAKARQAAEYVRTRNLGERSES